MANMLHRVKGGARKGFEIEARNCARCTPACLIYTVCCADASWLAVEELHETIVPGLLGGCCTHVLRGGLLSANRASTQTTANAPTRSQTSNTVLINENDGTRSDHRHARVSSTYVLFDMGVELPLPPIYRLHSLALQA